MVPDDLRALGLAEPLLPALAGASHGLDETARALEVTLLVLGIELSQALADPDRQGFDAARVVGEMGVALRVNVALRPVHFDRRYFQERHQRGGLQIPVRAGLNLGVARAGEQHRKPTHLEARPDRDE